MRPFDPRLVRHTRPARRLLALSVALGLATTVVVVAQATLLAAVVARAFLGGEGVADLAPELVGLLGVFGLRALLAGATEALAGRCAATATAELRAAVLERAAADAAGRCRPATGEVAALATSGLDAFDAYLSRYVPALVLAATAPVLVLAWILAHDTMAGAIVALTLPLVPLFMVLVGVAATQRARARLQTLSHLGAHFLDVVRGLPTLRAFRRGRAQAERIREVAERFRAETMATLRVAFLSALVLELVATLATAVVAVAVGLRLVHGGIDLQTALMILVLVPEAYLPLRAVGTQFHASADGAAAARAAMDLLDGPGPDPALRDVEGDVPLLGRPGGGPGRWKLRLEGVSVVDEGRPRPALDRIDLEIVAGERLAVVGPSGSGKSTLLAVLLGFTRPTAGRVVLERPGAEPLDLARVDAWRWRRELSWVPQEPTVVDGTVADNVRLGRPTAGDPEVWEALRAASLDGVVAGLPQGLATPLGEGGARLSAGERQRLALARAAARAASLVLLDEPTSNLDPASEAAVEEALGSLAAHRTLIVVAHRRRLLRSADRVVVLDDGRVTDDLRLPARAG